jgi:hypothetical protein
VLNGWLAFHLNIHSIPSIATPPSTAYCVAIHRHANEMNINGVRASLTGGLLVVIYFLVENFLSSLKLQTL